MKFRNLRSGNIVNANNDAVIKMMTASPFYEAIKPKAQTQTRRKKKSE